MANRVIESMTRVVCGPWTVRVWRTEKAVYDRHEDGLVVELAETPWRTARDIADRIETYPDVAAYEIVDEAGNGFVVYPDWS